MSWAVHPKPKDDELLSSWMVRIAINNGLKPSALWQIILSEIRSRYKRKIRTVGSHIDEYYFEDLIKFLSEKTLTPISLVEKCSLTSFSSLNKEYYPERTYMVWFLPHKLGGKSSLSGIQFCPECLTEDDMPYFRRKWRLSFVYICLKHQRILFDRCPKCKCCIRFLPCEINEKFANGKQAFLNCKYCKYDFRRAVNIKFEKITDQDLTIQKMFLDTLYREWIQLPEFGNVHSFLYFIVIYRIIQLLCIDYNYETVCSKVSEYYDIPYKPFSFKNQHRALEIMPIKERKMIMTMVGNL